MSSDEKNFTVRAKARQYRKGVSSWWIDSLIFWNFHRVNKGHKSAYGDLVSTPPVVHPIDSCAILNNITWEGIACPRQTIPRVYHQEPRGLVARSCCYHYHRGLIAASSRHYTIVTVCHLPSPCPIPFARCDHRLFLPLVLIILFVAVVFSFGSAGRTNGPRVDPIGMSIVYKWIFSFTIISFNGNVLPTWLCRWS